MFTLAIIKFVEGTLDSRKVEKYLESQQNRGNNMIEFVNFGDNANLGGSGFA